MGVPAPGALRWVSSVSLIRVTSLEEQLLLDDSFAEGMPLTEDDFDAGRPIEKPASQGRSLLPPASREAKGAEVSADESITACGCEEVDAAVPLAARDIEGLLHEDAPSSPFGRWWPKRDPARRRTAPLMA